ncbi:hypothetical protein A1O1_01774 [Capronia coronata CBS 617.96]|uniref:amidase n=1 Tax=Capronia coronata CBS 617.96 TaxID=1182541 RepID=W9YKI1_9EURO|nr:uncharacterized protein A1O1_01774 [Capronia coronata CBS 617.96]EXJ93382.1 hypothetical protein A1O1_01774 [Capronia coronata CBS 617.96]
MALKPWEEKAKSARDYRDSTLSKVEPPFPPLPDPLPLSSQDLPKQYLTAREYELTQNYDAVELLQMLRTKQVTSEELTKAFLRRAALAQYALNCVTELMWDEAIERAKYLDSLPEPVGPLHGLPISVKEHHSMFGEKTTNHASYVAWIGTPGATNPVNDYLYDAGCVYYARTTGPQTLMALECDNNIYGKTVNPWNRNLTSGGSSGGEGALVGFKGSVLGLGGDIGGSVRAPASNNGVYGFKPTTKRIPGKGMKHVAAGKESIHGTIGPLAQSRETINLFMKTILDNEPWRHDAGLTVKPWTPETITAPLKVAIEWHDGVVKPHPPVIRALQMVADACKAAGMDVVDWEPYKHDKAWDIVSGLYFPDGGEAILAPIKESGEPIMPLTKFIVEQPNVKNRTMHEYWDLCVERDTYRDEYAAHWSSMAESGKEVDVIICPTTPGAAPLHDTATYWPYTSQWNLLDYPAAVFPVTFVDPDKDKKDENYVPMNDQDKYNYDLYDPQKWVGAPVSLTIVGRRQMDEKVMAALELVEKAMGRK